jgi:hypothetical protein
MITNNENIRRTTNDNNIYYSMIDIIRELTTCVKSKVYWKNFKFRDDLAYLKVKPLKLFAIDGKNRLTDCATEDNIMVIIKRLPRKMMR